MAERITIGSSTQLRKGYFDVLGEAWNRKRLALFLGAGVSTSYGIPNWDGLVRSLLLHKSSRLRRLMPHYRVALATQLAKSKNFDFSPLSLASVVKYKIYSDKQDLVPTNRLEEKTQRLFEKITHEFLYQSYAEPTAGDNTLDALVELIARSERERRRIPRVVTFNFDDLLERKLNSLKKGFKAEPVYQATRRTGNELPVIHVNGYLPKDGHIPRGGIVLDEDSFHRLTYSMFDWSSAEIADCLRNYTVLFVGLSMSDPNLRRILYATRVGQGQIAHILLRKEHRLSADERGRLIEEIKRDAKREGEALGNPPSKDDQAISEAIDDMLKEAHTYDRQIFKSMGVGTLWFEEFSDLPAIIRAIPAHARKMRAK